MILTMITLQGDFSSAIGGMWPILLMFVVIYFFMIRPQTKKNKEQQKFVSEMQKGDEVITSSGIVGRINKIEDKFVHLQIDTKTFIKVLRSSVSKEMSDSLNASEDNKK